jgi:hypothetical protein
MTIYEFAFDRRFTPLLLPLGVTPGSAYVEVGREHLLARFGPWSVTTRLDNIVEAKISGPYAWYRAIGVRMSARDRGLTFGTNTQAGVCLSFRERVRGIDPLGIAKHPGLTLTLADVGGFMNAIDARTGSLAV